MNIQSLQKSDATVGAFVAAAAAVFILAAVAINRARFTAETYPIFITLPHIAGIDKGVDVMYQGYKAGSVDKISIAYQPKFHFIVRLQVKKEIELSVGTTVVVRNLGFAGGRFLELAPPERPGRAIAAGETLPTTRDPDLMSKANEVMGEVQSAFRRLQKEGTAAEVSQAIKRLNLVLAKLDVTLTSVHALVEENRPPLKATMERAHGIASKTDELLAKRQAALDETLDNLNKSLKEVPAIVGDVKELVGDIKRHPWKLLRKGDSAPAKGEPKSP